VTPSFNRRSNSDPAEQLVIRLPLRMFDLPATSLFNCCQSVRRIIARQDKVLWLGEVSSGPGPPLVVRGEIGRRGPSIQSTSPWKTVTIKDPPEQKEYPSLTA